MSNAPKFQTTDLGEPFEESLSELTERKLEELSASKNRLPPLNTDDLPEIVWWRLVEYQCESCHALCLNDHAEAATKYHECRSCYRVPDLERERSDHRLTSLLWAHLAASGATFTQSDGEAREVLVGAERPEAPTSGAGRKQGSTPDPEAGAPQAPEGRQTSGGAVELASDGGERD